MRLVKCLALFVLAATVSLGTIACGGGGDDDDPPDQGVVNADGTSTKYVMEALKMPTTPNEAQAYGLVLDGNDQNRPNNALGQILSTLANSADMDLQTAVDAQVMEGDIIILMNVMATSLTTATGVGNWVFLGADPTPDPCLSVDDEVCGQHLDGSGSFTIDPQSPQDGLIVGQLVAGKFTGGPGKVTIEISLVEGDDSAIRIDLIGARMEIENITGTTMTNGKLGGAVTEKDLDDQIMPTLHDILSDTMEDDCTGVPVDCPGADCAPCGCEEGATGRMLLDLFDEYGATPEDDPDCVVTLDELLENSLISSLLAPDVDLLDCPSATSDPSECTFNPRQDGINDSLSLGFAFTATTGSFTWVPPAQ
jgi:hypothetical protein